MTPHAPFFQARPLAQTPAGARAVPREEPHWTRPKFRPPPLDIDPFSAVLPYLGEIQRMEAWASPAR
jgi:hypothetical protein